MFPGRVNTEMVDLEALDDDDLDWLHDRIERHRHETGSAVGSRSSATGRPPPRVREGDASTTSAG
ncbi:MAG: hypothetical protein R2695_10655 [Acidimicrobiales bacterium]